MDAGFQEQEFQARKAALLAECKLAPQVFAGGLPRLEQFMEPFVESLARKEQVGHAKTFVQGLLSDLDHRNVESAAVPSPGVDKGRNTPEKGGRAQGSQVSHAA